MGAGVRPSKVTYGLAVWGAFVVTSCCAAALNVTLSGTTCELISRKFEHCTALPYTHTGFPNSFGHVSQDQVLLRLGGAFQFFTTVGSCHDDARLFLCAAAFPQCTTKGHLLPPCRSLCENAVSSGCGFGFGVNVLDVIDCKTLPDSSDSKVCVGLKTSESSVTTVTRDQSSKKAAIIATSPHRRNGTQDTKILKSETTIAPPSPRQRADPSSSRAKDGKRNDTKNGQPQSRTLLQLAKVDFAAKVNGAPFKMTDSVEKTVNTGFMLQDPLHQRPSTLPALAVMLSVASLAGMLTLVIACAFVRKAFSKSFQRYRRKPRDGAFYTNPAFSDLPQVTTPAPEINNVTGQSLRLPEHPYTLDDLPPHPAGVQATSHPPQQAEANIYQQEPGGFIEQNLFVAPQTPPDSYAVRAHRPRPDSPSKNGPRSGHAEHCKVTSDLVYSNKVTSVSVARDTNANERCSSVGPGESGINGTTTAPSVGTSFPMVSTDVDDGDTIIANPIAC